MPVNRRQLKIFQSLCYFESAMQILANLIKRMSFVINMHVVGIDKSYTYNHDGNNLPLRVAIDFGGLRLPLVAFGRPPLGSPPPPVWRATWLFSEKVITIANMLYAQRRHIKEAISRLTWKKRSILRWYFVSIWSGMKTNKVTYFVSCVYVRE